MTVGQASDSRDMAKQQRTVHLPAELFSLTDAFEARTGAKFNRQALAAFLQFFLSEPDGFRSSVWMRAAVAVEKGERSFIEVALANAQREWEMARTKREQAEGQGFDDLYVKLCHYDEMNRLKFYNAWKRIADSKKDNDELAPLIAFWEQCEARLPDWRKIVPEQAEDQDD